MQEEEVLGKAYDSRLMKRLLGYLRPYKWTVVVALIAIILKAAADVVGPYLTKVAIDKYLTAAPDKSHSFLDSFLSSRHMVGIGQIALITFAVLPGIFWATMVFRRAVRDSYRRIRVAIARINAYLQEHVSGIVVLQLFNREERAYQKFEK